MIVNRGLLCLILFSVIDKHPQIFPYLLRKFSFTTFYRENIHLSLTVLTPYLVMVRLTLPTYTHTLIQVLFTYQKILATWFERRGHPFSRGCIASIIVWGTCPLTPKSLCSYIPVSHTLMSPRYLVATSTSSRAPGSVEEPEEVGSLHCNHGNTFQKCSLQSL